MLVVPEATPLGSVMCVDGETELGRGGVHLGHEGADRGGVPLGQEGRHVGPGVDQQPFEGLELGQCLPGGDGNLGLLAHRSELIGGNGVRRDRYRRSDGARSQWVVGQHHIGRQHFDQPGDRNGLVAVHLTQGADAFDTDGRLARARPCQDRGRSRNPDISRVHGRVRQRTNPLHDRAGDHCPDHDDRSPRQQMTASP